MTFRASAIPHNSYWRYLRCQGKQVSVFGLPLVSVFAATRAEADEIAGPENAAATYDQASYVYACIDSAEAANRLGVFGRPDLAAKMERGD